MKRLLIVPLILLLACTPGNKPDIATAKADAQAVITGVTNGYNAIRTLYPSAVSSDADAQVQTILAAAPALIADLGLATDAATQASYLRGVEAVANQVLNIAADIVSRVPNVDPGVTTSLILAQVLLPVIEATANQLVPKVGARASVPAAFRSNMTVDEARRRLRGVR